MFLNICLLILVLNLGLFIIFKIKDAAATLNNPVAKKYDAVDLTVVYPDLDKQAINDLLNETWSRPLLYAPFLQFKERPYKGHYVNVSEDGFRVTANQGPWPPDPTHFNIFLFGGSTLFGYGLPDDQTIASYLQELLMAKMGREVRIYNFGAAFYYSVQERILLEQLLIAGFIPDMAIFVDGLNEGQETPFYTGRLQELFEQSNNPSPETTSEHILELLNRLPMARVAEAVRYRTKTMSGPVSYPPPPPEVDPEFFALRYLEHKKGIEALTATYDFETIFVWQPIPFYHYDLQYHVFMGEEEDKSFYLNMAELHQAQKVGDNFIWCANIQEGLQKPLYVDNVHYTAELSKMVAACIAESLPTP
jgi:hypothetical protein